jgi:hypothetical protein
MPTNTALLAELVDRKHACLVQLRDLGRRQSDLIDSGDLASLVKVLSGKQHLISLLQNIERELTVFRGEDPDARRWASPAMRANCADRSSACQQLLDEIVELEKSSGARLSTRRDEAAVLLQGAHSVQQARSAYAQSTPLSTNVVDLFSDQ